MSCLVQHYKLDFQENNNNQKCSSKGPNVFPTPTTNHKRTERKKEKVNMSLGASTAFSQLVMGKKHRKAILFMTA